MTQLIPFIVECTTLFTQNSQCRGCQLLTGDTRSQVITRERFKMGNIWIAWQHRRKSDASLQLATLTPDKSPLFCKQHFQQHFLKRKWLHLGSNLLKFVAKGPVDNKAAIGSNNGLTQQICIVLYVNMHKFQEKMKALNSLFYHFAVSFFAFISNTFFDHLWNAAKVTRHYYSVHWIHQEQHRRVYARKFISWWATWLDPVR